MKELFDTMEFLNWTPIILFGVTLVGIISLMQVLDDQSKNKFIQLEGKVVHNDYEPTGFRVLFVWCVFVAISLIYVIYNAYLK